MAAALRLFCERGYAAVSTQEICAAAGVHKGTLYHYFAGKMDVALAALDAYGDAVRAAFAAAAASGAPPRERLLELFATARRAAEADRSRLGVMCGCLHGNFASELAATHPEARARLTAIADVWLGVIAPILAALQADGDVPPGDPRVMAEVVLAYLNGVVLSAKTANDPAVITALGGRVFALLGGRAAG